MDDDDRLTSVLGTFIIPGSKWNYSSLSRPSFVTHRNREVHQGTSRTRRFSWEEEHGKGRKL